MNKNILILGKGFIGEGLRKELDCRIDGSMIRSFSDADKLIKKFNPKIIINCIGTTGRRNVDDCEAQKGPTLLANSFIPVILAEVVLRNNIKLVHISSGCIFNYDYKKNRAVNEKSQDYFFNLFYSRSKIYAERALEALSREYNILIVRMRIPLLNAKHPKNILYKLLKYDKIVDVPNSVTYIPDFVKAVGHLIKIDARGIYNVVNKGGLRYSDLLLVYKKYVPSFKWQIIIPDKLKLVRTNLILSVNKLERSGFKVRNINSVLDECVRGYLGLPVKGLVCEK
jgi:3,5-epimerase/4-reductase